MISPLLMHWRHHSLPLSHQAVHLNTLRLRQNGRHFADDNFKHIFLNENARISIKISLKFVPKGPINNIPALVQIMARRRPGDKPLSEPMFVSLPMHICVTRPQWVKHSSHISLIHWPGSGVCYAISRTVFRKTDVVHCLKGSYISSTGIKNTYQCFQLRFTIKFIWIFGFDYW